MRSLAMAEARARGAEAFPILSIELVARGLSLGRVLAAPGGRSTSLGQVSHVTPAGAWSEVTYGTPIGDVELKAVTCSVAVIDADRTLLNKLDAYNPRGSAARSDWAAPDLVADDWEPLFRGVLADWSRDGALTKLHLKTDDTVLRTPIPSGTILRTEWGAAYDGTVFGTAAPLVMGIHDSYQITARGSVPLVNLRYDKDIGYWWGVSADRMVEVTRLYLDGVPQPATGWSVLRGVYGSAQWVIVAFEEGSQPEKEVIVSVDCKGPDENGDSAGATLTGPPDQLRAIIEEFAYRRPPLSTWRGPHSIIGDSWATASEYYALHRFESARRFGSDQEPETAAEVIQSYLDAHRWARIFWSPLGTLEHIVIDPDDPDPDPDAFLDLDLHHEGGQVPFEPGDEGEVYSHVRQSYLWSVAEQKYMSAYEAHDIAALDEKVVFPIDNPWSQARLTQGEDDLNPAPPEDPEIPS